MQQAAALNKCRAPGELSMAWDLSLGLSSRPNRCSKEGSIVKREREKHYISSSHLGLIRCLTPFRVRISTIASI